MRTRIYNGKEQIFCEWRHRWVRLTPEEWVRQQLLHRLVDQLGYPASLIAVEVPFHLPSLQGGEEGKLFRCDAVVYANLPSLQGGDGGRLFPLLIIECKAETVPLTQKTLDQALNYNRRLNVPYLLLHNGPQSIFVTINSDGTNHNSQRIPGYSYLLRGE